MTPLIVPRGTVYGPEASPFFGRSLGINLLGAQKVCSFDCPYCSLGPTQLTMNKMRKEIVYPSVEDLESELRKKILNSLESIVFSGNGEPTLHPEFESMVATVKNIRDELAPKVPLIVMTNGAHLDITKVVSGLNLVDERVVKLDAGNEQTFKIANSPLVRLGFNRFYSNIKSLKDCIVQSLFFKGDLSNANDDAIEDWMEIMGILQPKAVHLSTVQFTPARSGVLPLTEDELYGISFKLKKRVGLEARVFAI